MTRVKCFKLENLGKKAKTSQVEIGKWYSFDVISVGQDMVGYGKVVEIENKDADGNTYCIVDKYFELPAYRPYATTKWYDNLAMAINE